MPYFEAKTNSGEILRILVDTGSNKNYIQNSLIKSCHPNKFKFYAKSVGGKTAITHHTFLNLFGLKHINIKFFLLPVLKTFHAILGNDTLKSLSAVIHTAENYMTIGGNIKIQLKQQVSQSVNTIQIRSDHMTEEQESKMNEIIQKYPNLFSEPNESLTYTTSVKGEIRTNTENPVYSRCYPYPMHLKDEVEQQLQELLDQGIIRPSKSPYNSPVWVVPKKLDASGKRKYRMVIDYRKLNAVTIADRYPIPEINEVLAQLGENKFFSVLDLKSGFHQISLRDKDIEKTAFSVNNGKYEFTRLPFGLKNAPSIFQRTLDDILREYIGKICFIYIDDIIVFGKNEEEHLANIEKIFKTLELANMKVQLDKCEFMKPEVEFLGFLVSTEGIRANPKKVEAIDNFPTPKTVRDLRSFLGMAGFYRRFIKDYAKLAKPLTALLRGEEGRMSKAMSSKIPITLNEDALEALDKIKKTLVSEDVMLTYPNFGKEFQLTTDASNYAIGAVLEQDSRPIMFISRTLSKAEEHYATNEKEMLAIVWALKSLRNYLYGAATVKIFTDHQPLTHALNNGNSNSKLRRWKATLEEYNYELLYKPGKANTVADALSRAPQRIFEISSTVATQHSNQSSPRSLIQHTDVPINAFKNQLIIEPSEVQSYEFQIVFPTYHRHIILEPNLDVRRLEEIFKKYLNPSVTNCIKTTDEILGKAQEIYSTNFHKYKVLYTRKMVTDISNESDQEVEIINEHNRAHRNAGENKAQLLEKCYFPQMMAKVKRITKACKICKENKYDRHPNNIYLQETPIPQYPGQIVHIDIYITERTAILTAIDKLTKYAQAKILKSRAAEDIKKPLREILLNFGMPDTIVMDNEKSFNSKAIIFMLENQFNVKVFRIPPYASTVNGQIERFHSTLSEIMRCLKSVGTQKDLPELLDKSIYEYNNTIHSTLGKKPFEAFFGRKSYGNDAEREKDRIQMINDIKKKQLADLYYHNRNRKEPTSYSVGEVIYVKQNKRLGTKLSKSYKPEVVKEDGHTTVLTNNGRIVHKNNIRN